MSAADDYVARPFQPEEIVFKTLFESSPLPMWIYDLDSLRFLVVNDAAVHRYGYSRTEFLNMTTNDLRAPEEPDPAGKPAEAGAIIKEWRGWRHRLKNGDTIEVEITTQGLKYGGRRAAFVIVNGIHVEEKPRPNQESAFEKFRPIFESSPIVTILFDQESGQIEDANLAAASRFGYPKEKLCALKVSELRADTEPGSTGDASTFWTKAIKSSVRINFKRNEGEVWEGDAQAAEVTIGDKKLVQLTIVEAPPKAPVEEIARRQNTNLRGFIDAMPVCYYKRTLDGTFEEVNAAFASLVGFTPEELTAQGGGRLVHFEPLHDDPAGQQPQKIAPSLYKVRKKGGEEIWVEDFARYVRDAGGMILYKEGFCRQAAEPKTESGESNKYEVLFGELPDIILFVRRSDGRILDANKAAEAAHGFSRDELLRKTIFDLRTTNSWEPVEQKIGTGNSAGIMFETVHRRSDGSSFPVETIVQSLKISDEDVFVSLSRDCSSRKRMEAMLKQSENKYRSIFERAPVGILHFDFNGVVTECNDTLSAIMGSSRTNVIGLRLLDLPSKELVSGVRSILEGKVDVYEGEYRSFTASKTIHVRTTFAPITTGIGRPAGGIGVFEDITEKDKADDQLRESEMRYRLLYEHSPVPYHILDSDWKICDVNASWVELLDFPKAMAIGKDFVEFVAPETADDFDKTIESFKKTGRLGNLETDLVSRNGRRITVAIEGKIVRNPDGEIRQSQFMLYDITERKMAENALKESEQKFRSLAESASTAIFMYQRNKICYVNSACAAVTGYDTEELLKMDFWDIVHPDFRELVKELGMARQRGDAVPGHYELKLQTKSGESRWIDFTAATAMYNGELAVLGNVYDVTERRSAKEKLEESEEQHRLIVDQSPDAIIILSENEISYLNPSAQRMLGIESGHGGDEGSIMAVVHAESRSNVESCLNEVRKTLKPVELKKERFLRRDGAIFDVDFTASPITYLGKPSVQIIARDITNRMGVHEQMELQNAALNAAASAIAVTDTGGTIVWANAAFEALTGYSMIETSGRNIMEIGRSDEYDENSASSLWESVRAGKVWHGEIVRRRKNGTLYSEDLSVTPVLDEKESLTHVIWVKQDATMRKSFEEQMLQSERLEGISQLAGGVVHDYNNILGVILGYGELLKTKLNDPDSARLSVEAILTAAKRGADLTKQLLSFEHEGVMSPKVVDVNKAIETMLATLDKSIGDKLKFEFIPLKSLWNVRIDPIYLYKMLVNMTANAADAVQGQSGGFEIKTSNVMIDESFVRRHEGFYPGEYVMISFSDTGKGMDKSTQEQIFEPFFTTKASGNNSGLGLATVYSIIKRNRGGITVRSTPGEGTTFCVYLPRYENNDIETKEDLISPDSLRSDKFVVLVEDQADLLELIKRNLEEYGYKVMAAVGPEEALDFCQAYPGDIDILLTDVILPGINGKELSEHVLGIRPRIKTMFMSGYSTNALASEGVMVDGVNFIQKPFTAYELARRLQTVSNG